MARESLRAELGVYDVPEMFRQAILSCKSSIWLFLTLALLSSVYETAVERSALLSGISFSSQNSNFSFQFSFDPNQPAQASQNRQNNDGMPEQGIRGNGPAEGESFLSRFLAMLVPSDPFLSTTVEQAQTTGLASDAKEGGSGFPGTDSDPNEGSTRVLDVNGDNPSSLDGSKEVLGESEELYSGSEDHRRAQEGDRAGDEFSESGKLSEEEANGDGTVSEYIESDEEVEKKASTQDGKEGEEESLEEDVDEADTDLSLPRLKIQTVGNDTKKNTLGFLAETTDLTFFTGKLLGGRGLDQGAMPHGGMTMLLMFLILAGALTIFLGVVGFQHAAVLGSVAYSVVSTHMGKRATTRRAIRAGFRSGIGRLMWLAILHATLRGLQSLFFMKTLFGGVMEMEQVEQLVLRLSVTPFAFLAPFRDVDATNFGMAVRIGLFVGFDYVFDGVAYCLYVVACWVTIMERNFWGLGALSRSWDLVKSMEMQALTVRVLEAVICGRSSRWLLQQALGQFPAAFVICTAQVYFLVLWLIFYFSARSIRDGNSQFSYRNLEDFLDRFK